jgi:predicted dehydrogenase
MTRVGVIGLGMMGNTHLDVYAKRDDVEVVAISDLLPDRLSGETVVGGNVEGQAQGGFDINRPGLKKYDEGKKLIKDKSIELVDICMPTHLHVEYARRALKAGKHVLVEKPVGRTYKNAKKLVDAAEKSDRTIMCAMCIRFWPAYDYLKQTVDSGKYGKVLAATFRRVTSHPSGDFYANGDECGGALLDLHIHDTDFVHYLFGLPESVYSRGYSKHTNCVDHVVTYYEYPDVPLVVAEGGWALAEGFGFNMAYTVNFENATLVFDLGAPDPLVLIEQGGQPQPVEVSDKMGYEIEIDYLLNCLANGAKPEKVTVESAAHTVAICDAEAKSVERGRPVKVKV